MRKLLLTIALLLPIFSGCRKMVDWYPVELMFYVQDINGKDLLDPSTESFIGDKICLSFNGNEYMLSPQTKTYAPVFYGLDIRQMERTGRYFAIFGELEGSVNRSDDYIVRFPDGTSRTIHYDRKVNHIFISARQHWYLDGKKVEYPISIEY